MKLSGDYVVSETFALTVDGDETFEDRAVPAGVVSGAVVAGTDNAASVSLLNDKGTVVDTVDTDAGAYTFTGVEAGNYSLEISADTFETRQWKM